MDVETEGFPVVRGSRIRVTRLDADGGPVSDPMDLVGAVLRVEFGPDAVEPEVEGEVDLLWEEEWAGVRMRSRGASLIRALTIVWGWTDEQVRAALQAEMNKRLAEVRAQKRVYRSQVDKYSANAWNGVPRDVVDEVMSGAGWEWVPVMSVGAGAGERMHVRYQELPEEALADRVVLRCSADEYVAVVGGVVRHPEDPSRNGSRTVYGYYAQAGVRELFAPEGGLA